MSETYSRGQVDEALAIVGYSVLQESDELTIYQTHEFPGGDIAIDWSRGECEWADLGFQLADAGADSKAIHTLLR